MNDYVLAVVCDHSRQPGDCEAPARVVSRAVYVPKPPDTATRETFGWLEWRELEPDDPQQPPAWQTPFGEAGRRHELMPERTVREHLMELIGMSESGEVGEGMHFASRWRFYCPDCEDTLPLQGDKADARFNDLRHAGERFVLFRQLAPKSE
ncbi:MAG TPA: hypothetical protein VNS81_06515 [Nocardioides sp.]|nr:hypothetical protein [Nocardioides sp.]